MNSWRETYRDAFSAFSIAQQDAFQALERLARFHYAVARGVLEAASSLGSPPRRMGPCHGGRSR